MRVSGWKPAGVRRGAGAPPLWRQVRDDLERRLAAGAFSEAFPGELELVEQYEVSRHTVRQAVSGLRDDGLVVSGRGRHPRVAEAADVALRLGGVYSLFDSVTSAGLSQRSVVRAIGTMTNAEAARHLGLPVRSRLLCMERLRMADDEPLALDSVWLPATLGAPLLRPTWPPLPLRGVLRPLRRARRRGPRVDPRRGAVGRATRAPGHRPRCRRRPDRTTRVRSGRASCRVAPDRGAGRPDPAVFGRRRASRLQAGTASAAEHRLYPRTGPPPPARRDRRLIAPRSAQGQHSGRDDHQGSHRPADDEYLTVGGERPPKRAASELSAPAARDEMDGHGQEQEEGSRDEPERCRVVRGIAEQQEYAVGQEAQRGPAPGQRRALGLSPSPGVRIGTGRFTVRRPWRKPVRGRTGRSRSVPRS